MSEKSRKLIEDLKVSMAYAIDVALDGDFATGYMLCEDSSGNILADKDTTVKSEDLRLKCRYPLKPKAAIIITPKKEF